jgi:putative redox protein
MSENEATSGTLTAVERAAGLRFTATVRGHTVVMDQPVGLGGGDDAPSPLELLGVSLGGCIALYVHQFCAARGIDDDELRVDVVAETARKPYRIGRFLVQLTLPAALPAEYHAAIERVVRTCPVHNTLLHPPEIALELISDVMAPAET